MAAGMAPGQHPAHTLERPQPHLPGNHLQVDVRSILTNREKVDKITYTLLFVDTGIFFFSHRISFIDTIPIKMDMCFFQLISD